MDNNNTFETTIPVHLIKAKDGKGNDMMVLEGVASTPSLDSDGENLDPKGFETDYFLKYGFMNWNHQTNNDPLSIVGKPIKAFVTKSNEFKIRFKLFPDNQKAQHIYQLQEILQSQGLALGLSIEGKVLERDEDDSRLVKRAQITGCAITPSPKNQDTVMQIVKANNFSTLSAYEDVDEDERQKALSAQSTSGQALSRESLDGNLKNTQYNTKKKMLKKGDIIDIFFRRLPTITNSEVNKLYDLTEKIQKSINMENQKQQQELVSDEAIEKALDVLGLQSQDQPTDTSDGDDTDSPNDQDDQDDQSQLELELSKAKQAIELLKKQNDQLKKGDYEEDDDDYEDDDDDDDYEDDDKMKKSGKKYKSKDEYDNKMKKSSKKYKSKDEYKSKMKKDEYKSKMKKGESTEPSDIDKFEQTVDRLLKGQVDQLNQKFKAVGQIYKSIESQNLQINERLERLEKQTPGAKSIQTKGYLKKGFETEDSQGDSLSISNNKQQICQVLTKSITQNGELSDKNTANDIIAFEQAGIVSQNLVQKAKDLGYKLVK